MRLSFHWIQDFNVNQTEGLSMKNNLHVTVHTLSLIRNTSYGLINADIEKFKILKNIENQ